MLYDSIDEFIFFPIGKKIYKLYDFQNISLQNLSIMSSIFYFLSLFFLEKEIRILASILYLLGHIFNCLRYIKYENTKSITQYEKIFDNISYSITNISFIFLFFNILIKKKTSFSLVLFFLIIFFNLILLLSFSKKESKKSDNFYNFYKKLYENNNEPIYKIYLELIKYTYYYYSYAHTIYNNEIFLGLGSYSIFIFFCILFF